MIAITKKHNNFRFVEILLNKLSHYKQVNRAYFCLMKTSKRISLQICLLLLSCCMGGAVWAQKAAAIAKGSKIEFRLRNHTEGVEEKITATNLKGTIIFDPKQLAKASFDITTDPQSTHGSDPKTVGPMVKGSLTASYPKMRIKSTSVTADGSVIYILHGNMTENGITKPVSIQFTALPSGNGYLFRGSFQVNRNQYSSDVQKDDYDDVISAFIEIKTATK